MCFSGFDLEHVPQDQLNTASIAAEDFFPFCEIGISGNQESSAAGVVILQFYRVDVTRRKLGMVEDVAEVATKLQGLTFANRELLGERHIEVVDRPRRQRIAAGVREDPQARS